MSDSHKVDNRDPARQSATVRSARTLLDEQAATLSPAITDALRDARARAMAASRQRKRPWFAPDARALAPMALAAMLLLAVSLVWLLAPSAPGVDTGAPFAEATATATTVAPASQAPASAPIALLAAEEGLDFYESVEFLLWLESREG